MLAHPFCAAVWAVAWLRGDGDNGAMGAGLGWPRERLMEGTRSIAWIGLLAAAIGFAACGPSSRDLSIGGQSCARVGDEACSSESGFPRARCGEDGLWQIVEYCGERTCIIESADDGGFVTRCGAMDFDDAATTSPAPPDAKGTDAAAADAVKSGDGTGQAGGGAGAGAVACVDGTCPVGWVCAAAGRCEQAGCLPPCGAGQLCLGQQCKDHCSGSCFAEQVCGADAKTCVASSCTPPSSLPPTARIAVAGGWAEAAAIPEGLCEVPLANAATASLAGNELLASLGLASVHFGKGLEAGLETLALVPAAAGTDVWLARRTQPLTCVQQGGCAFVASKSDNLSTVTPGGVCPSRWTTTGTAAAAWLPLQTAFERAPLRVSRPRIAVLVDGATAYLCGTVSGDAIRAAMTATSGAKALALPTDAQLRQAVPADADTDGDAKADGWRVAVRLDLAVAQLGGWLP